MNNSSKVNKILKNIKTLKIQGARNIAKSALYAYSLLPNKETKQKLISARPTEPMLVNTLHNFEKLGYKKTLEHFDEAQNKINKFVFKLIKNNSIIFTHCHSTNVVNALIYAKKHKKKFQVYNTETRPLYQGRKTAKELQKAGIKVTTFIDSSARIILKGEQDVKKPNLVLFGADAILQSGVINKVGSGMFAEIAHENKIPVCIVADSWKYSPKEVKLEQRSFQEVWKNSPKHLKIRNPAFEKIPFKYIHYIVSEFGILTPKKFLF